MADKETKCPWCGVKGVPESVRLEKPNGKLLERKSANCGSTLSAYLLSEGDFMPAIRVFENA